MVHEGAATWRVIARILILDHLSQRSLLENAPVPCLEETARSCLSLDAQVIVSIH